MVFFFPIELRNFTIADEAKGLEVRLLGGLSCWPWIPILRPRIPNCVKIHYRV